MSDPRDERRRKEKSDERKRQDELDRMLEEPQLPAFEAPASGKIVERAPGVQPPRQDPPPRPDEDEPSPGS